MPPADKAGCCKSGQLSSYKGPQVSATGCHRLQASSPPAPAWALKLMLLLAQQPWGTHASSSQGRMLQTGYSCFWQPRQDAANLISYLLIGPTVVRHRVPQAAELQPAGTGLGPKIDAQARTGVQGNSPRSTGGDLKRSPRGRRQRR